MKQELFVVIRLCSRKNKGKTVFSLKSGSTLIEINGIQIKKHLLSKTFAPPFSISIWRTNPEKTEVYKIKK